MKVTEQMDEGKKMILKSAMEILYDMDCIDIPCRECMYMENGECLPLEIRRRLREIIKEG